ncbi:MAG: PIG-L family deacetylase [Chloroflexi bacterium]|nr:PIG-L family deacetylase [Chloroflexota bacterium]
MVGKSEETQQGSDRNGKHYGLIVVAHPDDETLWTGGYLLMHPEWSWYIACLTRSSDPDRAPKFRQVLRRYGAAGEMADMDDGPEQTPLPKDLLKSTILSLLMRTSFDLILTHGAHGEYTRHRRHEETGEAVLSLWLEGRITTSSLWRFAYHDRQKTILPQAEAHADRIFTLPEPIWQEKYAVITGLYGFDPLSWEARTTPRREAFLCFSFPNAISNSTTLPNG